MTSTEIDEPVSTANVDLSEKKDDGLAVTKDKKRTVSFEE